jgi:Flp pilus assembly protein TadG
MGIFARALRRFGRNRRGAAAVEFALIAPVFFWLTMGMAEITMIGFSQTTLDFAVAKSARQIRIGQAQSAGAVAFHQAICDNMTGLVSLQCTDLYVDVDAFDSFVSVSNPNPLGANGAILTGQFGFNPGTSSQIVLVRGFYRWHVVTPLFQTLFANTAGGTDRLLTSTVLLRNEPF